MSTSSHPNTTTERLAAIYPFDAEILDAVGEVAERQNSQSYAEVMAAIPPVISFSPDGSKPVDVLDIVPRGGYDSVLVNHGPMGGTLNPDRIVRAATLAAAQPTTRVITVSNPGEFGRGGGKMPLSVLPTVYNGDLRPAVDPTLRYLERKGIVAANHVGPSYGADKAVTAAMIAHKYDQSVDRIVAIDPASVRQRTARELSAAFRSTVAALPGYIEATGSQAYKEARAKDSLLGYKLGILRATNLAIGHALAQGGFEDRLTASMLQQPEMHAGILWAEESELCERGLIEAIVLRAQNRFGVDRVSATPIPRERHAMTNHIYLNAALTMQGLKSKPSAQSRS